MKKKILLIFGGTLVASVLALGAVYAWNSNGSDVGKPASTPEAGHVKYHVRGNSMSPTIKDGDWLMAKLEASGVKRGDVIILHYPKDTSKIYCRRVAAVGGDRVVMKYFSNVKLTTVYTPADPEGISYPQGAVPNGNAYGQYEMTVGAGALYVIGDNAVPGGSYDSDEWGTLPVTDVAGIVDHRVEPSPRTF
ncbi:MAG: signal peptidase [Patescibacteria group bacterium]|nr:signal peptidase [Patescibacteria group bacterium]